MREPQAFPSMFGVLNLSMTIVCVLYITVGFYGYIEYGADCQDSITLNLESWFVFLYTACVLTMLLISVVGKGTGPV